MSTDPWLSVVLPCRNQADHIGKVLKAYLDPLEALGKPFELVVVPNACTDDTPRIVEGLAAHDPRVRGVASSLGGWGRSVRLGLDAARGSVLCYTNTARTDPTSLPRFVQAFEQQPTSLVKALRTKRRHLSRELGSLLYNLESRLLFGVRSGDVNGTPKVFSSAFYRGVSLVSNGDLLDLELVAWAARNDVPLVELPTVGFHRHGGKSTTNLKSAWNMYRGAVALRRQFRIAG